MEQLQPYIIGAMLIYGGVLAYKAGWFDEYFGKSAKATKPDNRDAYAQQMLAVDRHLTAEGVSLEDRQAKLTPLVPYMLQRNQPAQQMPACRFPEGQQ